jgi:hypothetical protein
MLLLGFIIDLRATQFDKIKCLNFFLTNYISVTVVKFTVCGWRGIEFVYNYQLACAFNVI